VVPVPTWLSVQLVELKPPGAAPFEKLAEPCGHDLLPVSVSDTVAVQVEPWLIATEDGEQATDADVVRFVTVNEKPVAVLLFAWMLSLAV
jgi:hypothetical protein